MQFTFLLTILCVCVRCMCVTTTTIKSINMWVLYAILGLLYAVSVRSQPQCGPGICYTGAYPFITSTGVVPGPNETVLFTVKTPPSLGKLLNNGNDLLDEMPFINETLLGYLSDIPYLFSVIEGDACGPSDYYDTFDVEARLYGVTNTTTNTTNITTTTHTLRICLLDINDLPVVRDAKVAINASTVLFDVYVKDEDDRVSLVDGTLSTYSFRQANQLTVSPGAGVVFNRTTFSTGQIRAKTCTGGVLTPGTRYADTRFCFVSNGVLGETTAGFRAFDKANGGSNTAVITFKTSDLSVCNDGDPDVSLGEDCIAYRVENRTILNATTVVILTIPNRARTLVPFVWGLKIESLPRFGNLYFVDEDDLDNPLVLLEVGDIIASGNNGEDAQVAYIGNTDYYNRYYYPEYNGGIYSFDDIYGEKLWICNNEVIGGCLDFFNYRATNENGSVTSELGRLDILVDREIIENVTTCATSDYSSWPLEACISYGEESSIIPVFLAGSDARPDEGYDMEITSLPRTGRLYTNVLNGTNYTIGVNVTVGMRIQRLYSHAPNLLYVPDEGYFNRLIVQTVPSIYVTMKDDMGMNVGNCSLSPGITEAECVDSFNYRVISGLNSSLQSTNGTFSLLVGRVATDQLTVCSVDGYSPSNSSCSSDGFETNTKYGDYDTLIFLNHENDEGEEITYTIRQLPLGGTLYLNIGTEEILEYGPVVMVNDTFSPRTDGNPDFIYVGFDNYFNDALFGIKEGEEINSNITRFVTDQKGVAFFPCVNGEKFGCPDYFIYDAIATPSGRKSNPGRYELNIHSLISIPSVNGPLDIYIEPTGRYYFTGLNRIAYFDSDFDTYKVTMEIVSDYGYFGVSSKLDALTFPTSGVNCFNTTGCKGFTTFYGIPSDIQRVLDHSFFVYYNVTNDVTVNATAEDDYNNDNNDDYEDMLYVSVVKKDPDGSTSDNAFIQDDNDTVAGIDVAFYVSGVQYEYESVDIPYNETADDLANAVVYTPTEAKLSYDWYALILSTVGPIIALLMLSMLACCGAILCKCSGNRRAYYDAKFAARAARRVEKIKKRKLDTASVVGGGSDTIRSRYPRGHEL